MSNAAAPLPPGWTEDKTTDLLEFLNREVRAGLVARDAVLRDGGKLDEAYAMYDAQARNVKDAPFPGAADLSSHIVTEKVDALRSRLTKTLLAEPIWSVEGYGAAASKAAMVEQVHGWLASVERVGVWIQKVCHLGLMEGTGVLECAEAVGTVSERRRMKAVIATNEEGSMLMGPNGPEPQIDEQGEFVEAGADDDQTVDVDIEQLVGVGKGPSYRVLSLKNFLVLPGHAADQRDAWGFVKRLYPRLGDLLQRANEGIYDADAVNRLSETSDRLDVDQPQKLSGQELASQQGLSVEKEIFEAQVRLAVGKGPEAWWLATWSMAQNELLRLQRDDVGQPRYFLFCPFPNPLSVYGYSLAQKLSTLHAEHTGIRNQVADRSNMVTNAPIKRQVTSAWDPNEVPWAPGAVIDVNDPNEVQAMIVQDVPGSVVGRENGVLNAAERISGLNDTALGQVSASNTTLGEVQMVSAASAVRVDECVFNLGEVLSDLFIVRHTLWMRAAEVAPLAPPKQLIDALAARGMDASGGITAQWLRGQFRGLAHGSSEAADVNRQRSNFAQSLQAMQQLSQLNPALSQVLGSADVFPALVDGVLRLYDFPTRHEVMRGLREWQSKAKAAEMAQPSMPPGVPGQPAGPPGPPGASAEGPGGPPEAGGPPGAPPGAPPGPGGPPGPPPPTSMPPQGMPQGANRGIQRGMEHLQQLPPGMVQ
jgi:hypothetical protein